MIDAIHYPHLARIDSPAGLKRVPEVELPKIAAELRAYLIESVASVGGHFGAGLGVVELTIALHYLYDTPYDRIVWDVGHQGYPHKILTGRRDAITSIKKRGGLAPFLRRAESGYDIFGVGHASTSISAALGMAIALRQRGDIRNVVAVIGDGALTGGMAYEALNHAGGNGADLLVVLNDNGMSISENVGGLDRTLARLRAGESGESGPRPEALFEELGFAYSGPIDGHDLPKLLQALRAVGNQSGPRLLHVITTKGKGYAPAERAQIEYHAVGRFDPTQGVARGGGEQAPTYSEVFGDWLYDMANEDTHLLAITPAMREGSGLVRFSREFPDRYFDVGIAEQHAVTLAAGLACEGAKPVVAIYSTFLQRAYDQLIHDVALQNLDVTFAIDRAGVVGPDGPTHAGSFDLTYLRCIPNMIVMAPADENECRRLLTTGFRFNGPAAIRYPRGHGPGATIERALTGWPIGKAELRRHGRRIALLAFGCTVAPAEHVGTELDGSVVNMRFVKPLDEILVLELARAHDALVTLEDNAIAGGAGSAVAETLAAHGVTTPLLQLGLPDAFLEHGTREELLADAGLDVDGIRRSIFARFPQFGTALRSAV
ncbi:MAG: 1-deoxy-D-xylulose-5-phosphate synthase [Rhodanobacteraceae bacterium]